MARRESRILQPRRDGDGEPQSGYAHRALHGGAPDTPDRLLADPLWALVYGLSCYRYVAAGRPLETYQDWLGRTGLPQRQGNLPEGVDGGE